MKKDHLSFSLAVKSLGDDGRFAGYASVFGVLDNHRDVVMPGAFKLDEVRKKQVKLLWQHRLDEPIGVIEELFEDENGLYVEGRLLLEGERGREAYSMLKEGAIKGLSIGYRPVRDYVDVDTGIRHLEEVELWEVSLVTFPANEAAQVTVVKGGSSLRSSGVSSRESIPSGEQLKASPQLIALSDALAQARATLRLP